ncbi:VirB3 family type IV secretion system protein [Acidithiobacillus sp. IBUN Pt1247-S3]|uniref:VirB3 family type IV secretion system protein n=1 Tax=Acidithiobacillus sp. IBUN Pt1247-S3 TaxID=3166642 RepID=UPI0034E5DFE5
MDGTRQVRLYQSLVRPHLVMGAERTATMYNAVFAMVVYFLTMSIPGIIVAVSLFILVQAVLMRLAKSDAQMIGLVQRARKYQTFYGDAATLDAKYREIPQSQTTAPTTKLLSMLSRKGTKHA